MCDSSIRSFCDTYKFDFFKYSFMIKHLQKYPEINDTFFKDKWDKPWTSAITKT